ncbi:membrane protein [Mycolicibacterium litorale]|uniref:Membrane protein n=2 Tax=Mycolicibacterium litorale TaxID=758802 RepID=A0AAD1IQ35_9MYCO|nr:S-formylglutathione hydrolase FrmB [Mycolicibacterium litorale]BBY15693.1 membrane protein [Mycolicibacterium litorale]
MSLGGLLRPHLSLMHGWIPVTVQIAAAVLLAMVVIRRTRPMWWLWVSWAVFVGAMSAVIAYWYVDSQGLAGEPAPQSLWWWIGLSGTALAVLFAGWRHAAWWRRGVSLAAVPMCLLAVALAVNTWTGYFPTVQIAWNQLTAGPLRDQVDPATVTAMQQRHVIPADGTVVPVQIADSASGFRHRGELVYLPPAWYASNPPPRLPAVMMIGGEFNTPADWVRAGNAVATADAFAAAHHGYAPVLVFADAGGAFNNDTECVDGSRGNSADHLTEDVRPYVISHFGVSAHRSDWGIVGWSMGGTCAVDLSVMHPELFSAFEDIAGDLTPNAGTKAQTIARLYGGNAAAWAAYDPATVMTRHGRYTDVAGWFDTNSAGPEQTAAANTLCALGAAHGIDCAVAVQPGMHDWPFADQAFAAALPWLAGRLGTPGVAPTPLPKPQVTASVLEAADHQPRDAPGPG